MVTGEVPGHHTQDSRGRRTFGEKFLLREEGDRLLQSFSKTYH